MMNKFTSIIHGKGWTVKDAIEFWDIDYSTYNRRCNNPKMFNQLESMCKGLSNKHTVYNCNPPSTTFEAFKI